MSDYKRLYMDGGCYFFTVVTADRRPLFSQASNVNLLRGAFRYAMNKRPFSLAAIVILPDHLHCLWTLPAHDADFSTRWNLVKGCFSRHFSTPIQTKRTKPIWQPRFWEHWIRGDGDLHRHLDYIHYNPVKHGLTGSPAEWPHSSFRRFVDEGLYDAHWGRSEPSSVTDMELD